MQANKLPMQHGWTWLRDGFALWLRNPALLTFSAFGYLLVLFVVSLVPIIGQALASLLMPALSLGVLNACRAVNNGRKIGPDVLFSGFKSNLPELIKIGGLYLVASFAVLILVSLVDGGLLMRLMQGQAVDEEAAADAGLRLAILLALAMSTPIMMAYWFAPPLVGWWKLPATKALFFSFHGCLRNWRAFLAFAIALTLCSVALVVVVSIIGLASPALAMLVWVPLPLVVAPVIFASFYINARDVFGLPDTAPFEPQPPEPPQTPRGDRPDDGG